MNFILEAMKNKISLLERQNELVIASTNKILQENTYEIKRLLEISKEKDLNLLNLDEQLKKKADLISEIEGKLYSIPVVEHKMEFLSSSFDLEKKKLNEQISKRVKNYEKLLNGEKIKNLELEQTNKSMNLSCSEGFMLNSQVKGMGKEIERMRNALKYQKEQGSNLLCIPKIEHE